MTEYTTFKFLFERRQTQEIRRNAVRAPLSPRLVCQEAETVPRMDQARMVSPGLQGGPRRGCTSLSKQATLGTLGCLGSPGWRKRPDFFACPGAVSKDG